MQEEEEAAEAEAVANAGRMLWDGEVARQGRLGAGPGGRLGPGSSGGLVPQGGGESRRRGSLGRGRQGRGRGRMKSRRKKR